MEKSYGAVKSDDDQIQLPPGFRFHPTDEELISHYLSKKVLDSSFNTVAIGDVDMNKVEPWELPWKAKLGEKEWYFFCVRDKKYPSGTRTNRATAAGYWKATGKDKEIFRGKFLVGMKKTLVFYKGRATKGEKSNWVSHEYRLEGKFALDDLPKTAKNEWVIIRVFHKTSGGQKVHISDLRRMDSHGNGPAKRGPNRVHCFSNSILASPPNAPDLTIPPASIPGSFPWEKQLPGMDFQFQGSSPIQDFRNFDGNYGKKREMVTVSRGTAASTGNSSGVSNLEIGKKCFGQNEVPCTSTGAQDLDCIWSY